MVEAHRYHVVRPFGETVGVEVRLNPVDVEVAPIGPLACNRQRLAGDVDGVDVVPLFGEEQRVATVSRRDVERTAVGKRPDELLQ